MQQTFITTNLEASLESFIGLPLPLKPQVFNNVQVLKENWIICKPIKQAPIVQRLLIITILNKRRYLHNTSPYINFFMLW